MKSSSSSLAELLNHPALESWLQQIAQERSISLIDTFPSAQAFLISALSHRIQRSGIVLCERFKEMETMAATLEAWLGEEKVDVFPPTEINQSDALADSEITAQQWSLLQR